MGRQPRIEYEGAAYHVMSRGNGGMDIYCGDEDRLMFLDVLDQTCERSGWEVHGYVLMRNHYHILIVTPYGNLVKGMKWLQGTYTKRFNGRHKRWGHVMQGRYKAQNIDSESEEGYFRAVGDYIHLNPARAGLIGGNRKWKRLEEYPWSSLVEYGKEKKKRKDWLRVDWVLGEHGLKDNRVGRRKYKEYMEERRLEEKREAGLEEMGEEKRWYYGGEGFKERLLERVEAMMSDRQKESIEGKAVREVNERAAERIIEESLRIFKIKEEGLEKLAKGDIYKGAIAWKLKEKTTVENEWISERLKMGHRNNVTHAMRKYREEEEKEIKRVKKKLE